MIPKVERKIHGNDGYSVLSWTPAHYDKLSRFIHIHIKEFWFAIGQRTLELKKGWKRNVLFVPVLFVIVLSVTFAWRSITKQKSISFCFWEGGSGVGLKWVCNRCMSFGRKVLLSQTISLNKINWRMWEWTDNPCCLLFTGPLLELD